MANQGFRGNDGVPYVYQDNGTASMALSVDTANSNLIKLIGSASTGVSPSATAQISIDPAANGNVVLTPNGSGKVNIAYATSHGTAYYGANGSLLSSAAMTNGQLLIGSTGANPVAANLTSTGATITITNSAGGINLEAAGATFDANSGTASPSAGVVNLLGVNNITTSAAGNTVNFSVTGTTNHAVQIGNASGSLTSLGVGTNGQVLIGSTGADPAFSTITSTGGTITFTAGAHTLNMEAAGTIPTSFVEDSGTAVPSAGVLNINGGANITTSGATNVVTIKVSGTTNHSIQLGNSTGSLNSLTNGTTGQYLSSNTGADPAFVALGVNTGLTAHSVVLAQGNSAFTALGAATNGQIIIGSTGADPVLAAPTNGNNISWTTGAGSLRADVTGTTNHAVQIGNSSGSLTSVSVGANGAVLLGATGADPAFALLTSTGGTISYTTGANSLNLEAVGGIPWVNVTGTTQSMAINTGYTANNAGLVTLTLPSTAAVNSRVIVAGGGAGGWRIAQNAGQTINWTASSATTTGTSGHLDSTDQYDSVELIVTIANTGWVVRQAKGNISIT